MMSAIPMAVWAHACLDALGESMSESDVERLRTGTDDDRAVAQLIMDCGRVAECRQLTITAVVRSGSVVSAEEQVLAMMRETFDLERLSERAKELNARRLAGLAAMDAWVSDRKDPVGTGVQLPVDGQ